MENTSLDDFLDVSDQTTEESEATTTDDASTEVDDPPGDAGDTGDPAGNIADTEQDAAVEPACPPTAQWAADGATCGVCDERVTRRWRDDGRLVCAGCKNWE